MGRKSYIAYICLLNRLLILRRRINWKQASILCISIFGQHIWRSWRAMDLLMHAVRLHSMLREFYAMSTGRNTTTTRLLLLQHSNRASSSGDKQWKHVFGAYPLAYKKKKQQLFYQFHFRACIVFDSEKLLLRFLLKSNYVCNFSLP